MNELRIYEQLRDLCRQHTHANDWQRANGFGVGYMFQMNADGIENNEFQTEYFYSELWEKEGSDPEAMKQDFPFVLLLPPQDTATVGGRGTQDEDQEIQLVLNVWDVYLRDRHGNTDSTAARRSKERVWNHCKQIGFQIIQELVKKPTTQAAQEDWVQISAGGAVTVERLWNYLNKDLIGVQLSFQVKVHHDCDEGVFDSGEIIKTPEALGYCLTDTNDVRLFWTDTSTSEVGFEIQRRTGGGPWATIVTTAPDVVQYDDTGLADLTQYEYRIRAVGSDSRSMWTDPIVACTLEPLACDDGTLKDTDDNTIGTVPSGGEQILGDFVINQHDNSPYQTYLALVGGRTIMLQGSTVERSDGNDLIMLYDGGVVALGDFVINYHDDTEYERFFAQIAENTFTLQGVAVCYANGDLADTIKDGQKYNLVNTVEIVLMAGWPDSEASPGWTADETEKEGELVDLESDNLDSYDVELWDTSTWSKVADEGDEGSGTISIDLQTDYAVRITNAVLTDDEQDATVTMKTSA